MKISKLVAFHRDQNTFQKYAFLFPKIPRLVIHQTTTYSPIADVVKKDLCIDVSQAVSQTLACLRLYFTVGSDEKYFSGKGKQVWMSKIKTA